EPDAHWPPTGSRGGLDKRHVDAIDVGALLAIHFDRHERRVEHSGDIRILERLVRHDMAPVARRIADGQKNRLVLDTSLAERFVAPRKPVDRVVGVLKKIRTVLAGESIHRLIMT